VKQVPGYYCDAGCTEIEKKTNAEISTNLLAWTYRKQWNYWEANIL